jgi:hypothetical protein
MHMRSEARDAADRAWTALSRALTKNPSNPLTIYAISAAATAQSHSNTAQKSDRLQMVADYTELAVTAARDCEFYSMLVSRPPGRADSAYANALQEPRSSPRS